ncbi:AbrB family transcriptional regulator [Beijerinckiaceae bacterium RH AL1]|nr:AbrB/MazE/SpoVT family DNA-binding domain-containing protein [Beijerinckiaceae bacterium]VVB47939.1 AbrB family transcriptional regulator [Beijerinckiaceae bacterium RH CH11]VVB48016.1 AbrB family transcriptional regulator [Beijerinckiaceae bacterium RH AL8]VVC56140.1 AbrB family transcriptional regulator [Beijerinckiaceae bacterium RH AL1]
MRVSKWGNSLAVRLPAAIVELLELEEGDEIAIEVAGKRTLGVERDRNLDELFARLDELGLQLPPGFRFSRDEANERGSSSDE